ncbi:MAG: DNA gyrase modulator, partial [Pyrinomonadaceae bacterium]
MSFSRREFLKAAGVAMGGAAILPSWMYGAQASTAFFADVNKDALADAALATAKKLGASYADIRINRYRIEAVNTRERQVLNVSSGQNFGFGVRVLINGTWGFAGSPILTVDEVKRVTTEAAAIAKANSTITRKKIELVPTPKVVTTWKSSFEKDPFDVPIDEKVGMLLRINEAALAVKGISFVNSSLGCVNEQKYLATSDGSRVEQYIIRTNPSFSTTATNRTTGDFQSVNSLREAQQIGFEYVTKHDWVSEAKTAAEHAVMKLFAPSVTPGKFDLVLHPSHLFLTIHE